MLVARPFCPVFVEEKKSVSVFAKERESWKMEGGVTREAGQSVQLCSFGRFISLLFELTKNGWMACLLFWL